MNAWLIAATVLVVALVVCGGVAAVADVMSALVALELASVIAITLLLLLAEGTRRSSFVDLALVAAVLAIPGGLMFARLLERRV